MEYKRESFDMFEAMMERFQEETVRYLYLMQVIERREDGGKYSSEGPVDGGTQGASLLSGNGGNGAAPTRSRAATSMDDMEAAFQRRKRRELEQARMAGRAQEPVQQVMRGDKVGRNDPCPCGSGKKYKKCCGA